MGWVCGSFELTNANKNGVRCVPLFQLLEKEFHLLAHLKYHSRLFDFCVGGFYCGSRESVFF